MVSFVRIAILQVFLFICYIPIKMTSGKCTENSEFPPLIISMFSYGCSISSFSDYIIADVLKLHGVKLFFESTPNYTYEQLRTDKNFYFNASNPERNSIEKALIAQTEEAICQGKTFFFKGVESQIDMLKNLSRLFNGKILNLYRRNLLDKLVCDIRDCFSIAKQCGVSVNEKGEKSDLCFRRRTSKEKIYADINTHEIKKCIDAVEDKVASANPSKFIATEDLAAFQYENSPNQRKENIEISYDALLNVLKNVGILPDHKKIRQFLKEKQSKVLTEDGKLRRLELHNNTIYNIDGFIKFLHKQNEKKTLSYLRIH